MNINQEIIKVWNEENISKLVPQFYGKIKTGCLLIIGLNPSFSKKGYRTFLTDTPHEDILKNLEKGFLFKEFDRQKDKGKAIKKFIAIEKLSMEKYSYYIKFSELAKSLELHWEHIDLFFIRDTKQQSLEYQYKKGNKSLSKQLKLSYKLIRASKPKLIVVANAFASKIFQNDHKLNWDNNLGTYIYKDSIPIFLSSMLTGQRSLDNGSYERLKWHLNYVKNRIIANERTTKGLPQGWQTE